jgi:hypothetical protein
MCSSCTQTNILYTHTHTKAEKGVRKRKCRKKYVILPHITYRQHHCSTSHSITQHGQHHAATRSITQHHTVSHSISVTPPGIVMRVYTVLTCSQWTTCATLRLSGSVRYATYTARTSLLILVAHDCIHRQTHANTRTHTELPRALSLRGLRAEGQPQRRRAAGHHPWG